MARFFKVIRILWITFGILFFLWMAESFRVRGFDAAVLESDAAVTVESTDQVLHFRPNGDAQPAGFIFYPGAMVAAEGYAPMARALAEEGFSTFLIRLPFGSAPLAAQQARVMQIALETQQAYPDIRYWVVGGHSRGGAIAARFAHQDESDLDGMILIGTSHPKEAAFDISDRSLRVTKIYASLDGLASEREVEAAAKFLPKDTRWVRIEGGNHAQFGYYGAQLGDQPAEISRAQQQAQMLDAIRSTLEGIQER